MAFLGYIKRKHVKRILSYARNRRFNITILNEYNNSMGYHYIDKYSGVIKEFQMPFYEEFCDFNVIITFEDGSQVELWLSTNYEFYQPYDKRLFTARMCNSGPYCYFTVKINGEG